MFGYVHYDKPNLYIKDYMLYQSMYCGLCKGIGMACGQLARFGLSYDIAFLSVLLHNMTGTDIRIEQQNCFEHCIGKRPIAAVDPLTEELGALNTLLVYYKLTDDAEDRERRGKLRHGLFRKGFRRARKRYPELDGMVARFMRNQQETESSRTASCEMAADPTACLMRELSDHFLKEKATDSSRGMFYELGKWVYLIDALDDYDKDRKRGNYNPFLLSYGCESRAELMERYGEEISFLFDTLFYSLRENLAGVSFSFNRDLTDNVLLRGLPLETARVMRGEKRNKEKRDAAIKL